METLVKVFKVEGMSCSHCERAVKNEIHELDGILQVTVDLAEKTVAVEFDHTKVTEEKIAESIIEAGYEVLN